MIKKIVIANLISYGIATIIGLALVPVTIKVTTDMINKSFEENENEN